MRSAAWPSQSSGTRPRLPPLAQDLVDRAERRGAVASDERVGALLDGDRPLGVRRASSGRARRAPSSPPGCRRNRSAPGAPLEQAEHLEVALRRQAGDRAAVDEIAPGRSARCWRACADAPARRAAAARAPRAGRRADSREASRIVDVRWPMQRDDAEARRRPSSSVRVDAVRARASRRRHGLLPMRAAASRSSRCRRTRSRSAAMPSRARLACGAALGRVEHGRRSGR